jgi:hypothetical protein
MTVEKWTAWGLATPGGVACWRGLPWAWAAHQAPGPSEPARAFPSTLAGEPGKALSRVLCTGAHGTG